MPDYKSEKEALEAISKAGKNIGLSEYESLVHSFYDPLKTNLAANFKKMAELGEEVTKRYADALGEISKELAEGLSNPVKSYVNFLKEEYGKRAQRDIKNIEVLSNILENEFKIAGDNLQAIATSMHFAGLDTVIESIMSYKEKAEKANEELKKKGVDEKGRVKVVSDIEAKAAHALISDPLKSNVIKSINELGLDFGEFDKVIKDSINYKMQERNSLKDTVGTFDSLNKTFIGDIAPGLVKWVGEVETKSQGKLGVGGFLGRIAGAGVVNLVDILGKITGMAGALTGAAFYVGAVSKAILTLIEIWDLYRKMNAEALRFAWGAEQTGNVILNASINMYKGLMTITNSSNLPKEVSKSIVGSFQQLGIAQRGAAENVDNYYKRIQSLTLFLERAMPIFYGLGLSYDEAAKMGVEYLKISKVNNKEVLENSNDMITTLHNLGKALKESGVSLSDLNSSFGDFQSLASTMPLDMVTKNMILMSKSVEEFPQIHKNMLMSSMRTMMDQSITMQYGMVMSMLGPGAVSKLIHGGNGFQILSGGMNAFMNLVSANLGYGNLKNLAEKGSPEAILGTASTIGKFFGSTAERKFFFDPDFRKQFTTTLSKIAKGEVKWDKVEELAQDEWQKNMAKSAADQVNTLERIAIFVENIYMRIAKFTFFGGPISSSRINYDNMRPK